MSARQLPAALHDHVFHLQHGGAGRGALPCHRLLYYAQSTRGFRRHRRHVALLAGRQRADDRRAPHRDAKRHPPPRER